MIDVRKIGIVRLSALGDVVLLVPTVRMLQSAWPDAQITWITCDPARKILQGLSGVRFEVIEKPASLIEYWRLRRQYSAQHFDILLCMQASLRANLIYPLIPAARKIGFDNKRGKDGHRWFVKEQIAYKDEHLLDGFRGFAHYLGVNDQVLQWNIPINPEDEQFARAQLELGRWVAINPCASKAERDWPVSRFLQLIDKIKAGWNVGIVLTGGPNPREVAIAKNIAVNTEVLNLVGKTTPKQLIAVLARAEVLVAPDTGPVHLAVAQNIPVVGLYAVARPELSGPYDRMEFSVNCYPDAVHTFLHKKFADADWHERVHHKQAMSLITVDAVMEKLACLLD